MQKEKVFLDDVFNEKDSLTANYGSNQSSNQSSRRSSKEHTEKDRGEGKEYGKSRKNQYLTVSESSSEKSREIQLTKLNASYGESRQRCAPGERFGASTWEGYKWGDHTWHQHDDEFAPWYDVLELKHMITGFRPSAVPSKNKGLSRLAGCFSRNRPQCGLPKSLCMNPIARRMKKQMTYMEVWCYFMFYRYATLRKVDFCGSFLL